jgi:hypothetical protein
MIRPTAGGGYASFKTPLDNFGKLRVTGSLGITGSIYITGSEIIQITGSGLFGARQSSYTVGSNGYTVVSEMANGLSKISIGNDSTLPYRSGFNIWQSSSLNDYGSGSGYTFLNFGQSKTPYGGIMQHGYVIRSQYAGTTVGSASFYNMPTASVCLWRITPSFNDQTDGVGSALYVNALNINQVYVNSASPELSFAAFTGSYGLRTLLSIGLDDGTFSTGKYSGISQAGLHGIRCISGSLFMPSSWGFKLGHFGGVSYSNHVRLGNDLNGDGYIAFASGADASGMLSTPNVSASLALVTGNGNIVISTGFGGLLGYNRTIVYGSLSTTGSVNSTGYINLPRGSTNGLGIPAAAELMTGSIAFDSSSLNMVVFTGNGSTTFAGSAGWKVATLT